MKEHIKRVDRILKYKGSILDIYTDVIETPDVHHLTQEQQLLLLCGQYNPILPLLIVL